jgi:hypothetical protein
MGEKSGMEKSGSMARGEEDEDRVIKVRREIG